MTERKYLVIYCWSIQDGSSGIEQDENLRSFLQGFHPQYLLLYSACQNSPLLSLRLCLNNCVRNLNIYKWKKEEVKQERRMRLWLLP